MASKWQSLQLWCESALLTEILAALSNPSNCLHWMRFSRVGAEIVASKLWDADTCSAQSWDSRRFAHTVSLFRDVFCYFR